MRTDCETREVTTARRTGGAVLLPLLLVWLQPTSADAGGAGCASPPCGVNQYEIIVDGEARCCPVVDGDKSGIGKQSGWGIDRTVP